MNNYPHTTTNNKNQVILIQLSDNISKTFEYYPSGNLKRYDIIKRQDDGNNDVKYREYYDRHTYAAVDCNLLRGCKKSMWLDGDIFEYHDSSVVVMSYHKKVSEYSSYDNYEKWFDINGMEIPNPTLQELTLKEIADKLNIPVENLRIKE